MIVNEYYEPLEAAFNRLAGEYGLRKKVIREDQELTSFSANGVAPMNIAYNASEDLESLEINDGDISLIFESFINGLGQNYTLTIHSDMDLGLLLNRLDSPLAGYISQFPRTSGFVTAVFPVKSILMPVSIDSFVRELFADELED